MITGRKSYVVVQKDQDDYIAAIFGPFLDVESATGWEGVPGKYVDHSYDIQPMFSPPQWFEGETPPDTDGEEDAIHDD